MQNGRLAPCKRTPNCVSSQADPADAEHYIAPISVKASPVEAIAAVRRALERMERVRVIREQPGYLYAEFRTRLLRYVDDVEFAFDEGAQVMHVRSASRLGRSDLGVNRKRVEAIRAMLGGRSGSSWAGPLRAARASWP